MKQFTLFLVILILSTNSLSAQRSKKKNRAISFSSSLNFGLPNTSSYSWDSRYRRARKELDLTYNTPTSGVFEVETDTISVWSQATIEMPSNLIGLGMSLQIKNRDNIFHEFSIPKLSFQKVRYNQTTEIISDSLGYLWTTQSGRSHNSFVFAFRYEFGKYFGDPIRSKVNFGLSAAVGTSLLLYSSNTFSRTNFPIYGHQIDFDFAFIPSLQFKLTKALAMDFKAIPYFVIGAIKQVEQQDPSLLLGRRKGELDQEASIINLSLNLHLRYAITYIDYKSKRRKKRKKRRKRRKRRR